MGNKENLTIAFDTWALNSLFRNQGIHVYAKHLLGHFRELAALHSVEVRPFTPSGVQNDANTLEPASGFRPRQASLLRFDRLWRYGGAWLTTWWQNPDVIFCPASTTMHLPTRPKRAVTIHDVSPVVTPDFAPASIVRKLRRSQRWAAKFSDRIVTDSICSKRDLVEIYGLPESKVSVIYLGYDKSYFNADGPAPAVLSALLRMYKIERPYLFHHGLVQPRKNLKRLVEGFGLVLARNPNLDFDLVLAGALGWKGEELVAAANGSAGSRGKVVFTGGLSDLDLATLLKGATLVVIPSLYEGFCLPMVEAMACGVPTIAANTSCLPEISGGVLRYFNPESVEEMASCMEAALESASLRKELSEKGKSRASQFDWRCCAEQTLDVLVQCGNDK